VNLAHGALDIDACADAIDGTRASPFAAGGSTPFSADEPETPIATLASPNSQNSAHSPICIRSTPSSWLSSPLF
jgi:hypothetical protein